MTAALAIPAAALSVRELTVSVDRPAGRYRVVDEISFGVAQGKALGIVGESGSGKSLTLRALMGLAPTAVHIEGGTIELDGAPLPLAGRAVRASRRGRIAMVFQDPLSSLDPVHTVGSQVAEVPRRVLGVSRRRAWERAVELLGLVGIPAAAQRARAFPHQLSGGMRQRVAIAIALASDPAVLLCDEPTTALDVTVQAQILDLLATLRARLGLSIVFVSHDLAVVRQLCDDVCVMYAGRLVETGPTPALLSKPAHPYTLGLRGAALDLELLDEAPVPIPGALPEPGQLPDGCAFHPRCGFATPDCGRVRPELRSVGETGDCRASACLHLDAVLAAS